MNLSHVEFDKRTGAVRLKPGHLTKLVLAHLKKYPNGIRKAVRPQTVDAPPTS